MGVSTDALLYYGFTIYDEEEGVGESPTWETESGDTPTWFDWPYGVEKELRAEVEALGVDVICHCHSEYPVFVLCLSGHLCAYRGYPKKVESLEIPNDAEHRLRKASELLGVEFREPKWELASYWG